MFRPRWFAVIAWLPVRIGISSPSPRRTVHSATRARSDRTPDALAAERSSCSSPAAAYSRDRSSSNPTWRARRVPAPRPARQSSVRSSSLFPPGFVALELRCRVSLALRVDPPDVAAEVLHRGVDSPLGAAERVRVRPVHPAILRDAARVRPVANEVVAPRHAVARHHRGAAAGGELTLNPHVRGTRDPAPDRRGAGEVREDMPTDEVRLELAARDLLLALVEQRRD